jgi:organic radical activating enzyme
MSPTPSPDLRVSEIFASIQGEGPSAGERCTFLRLAHCNLRCQWCDTRYSWDWERYAYEREVRRMTLDEVAATITDHAEPRLVLTGGEPLLQQDRVAQLLGRLPKQLVIEVETNGTVRPAPALLERVDQWNVSPKLAGSGEPRERRLVPEVLAVLAETGRAWLKIVVGEADDPREAMDLVEALTWPRERVLFMPEADSAAALRERAPRIVTLAQAEGVGVSPRLHVERFGGARGR